MNVIKQNHYGEVVLAKQIVVSPEGRVVAKHPHQPLKPGWRMAIEADLRVPAPEVAPLHLDDEPIVDIDSE